MIYCKYWQQDSIPVGCVPTAAVTSTPGEGGAGGGVLGKDTVPPWILYTQEYPTPERNLTPETPPHTEREREINNFVNMTFLCGW